MKEKRRTTAKMATVIIDGMMDAVVITDLEGRITQFNKVLTESFGWGKEVMGELPTIFVAERDIPKVMDGIKECIEKGFIRNLECTWLTKDKKEAPVLLNVKLIRGPKGNPTGMIAVARGITELKRAEEGRVMATVLEGPAIADAMIDSLIVTDLDGNIIFINRSMEEYLVENGADAKELVGKSALELPTVRPEDTEKFVELMKEVVEKGRAGPVEFQDVAGRWAGITVSLMKDANGNPSALFAIRRDITELKRSEEERVRAAADRARAEEMEKRIQKMRLIYEGSRKMALSLEPDEIYNRALELACTAMEADGGSVMTFDEKTGELVVKVASGAHKEVALGKRLKLGERFAGHAAQMKKALFMHDVENEPWFKSLKKFEEIKSGMSIPLLARDKLVGVINLKRTRRDEKFAKSDMGLVSILADYVASIIELARLYRETAKSRDQLRKSRVELENKVKDLEEFHELVVGRELKMKQMETELERLRAKLEEK